MENSDIKVKSTELHFFFVKIVTVLIFTFTINSSFNYVFSGSANAPAISNNTLLKTIIFIFVGEVLSNKYFSDSLDRSFLKLYLFFILKNNVSSCIAYVADHRLNPRYRLFRVPYLGLEWQVRQLRTLRAVRHHYSQQEPKETFLTEFLTMKQKVPARRAKKSI